MNDGFQFFDIILFAMVAAFLVLRLRGVLGRRTGTEQRRDPFRRAPEQQKAPNGAQEAPGRVIELPRRGDAAPGGEAGNAAGLAQISIADRSFSADGFLAGARAAFEMIVTAYAQGDTATLRPLLADDVYDNFAAAIRGRQDAKQTLETTLIGIKTADLLEARMEGRTAFVTVKFVSEQVNVTRNAAGEIVEGDPNRVTTVTDVWTFARNTRASDPNWALVQTSESH